MPAITAAENSPILRPAEPPAAPPPPEVKPAAVPGFDPAGAPLADTEVWSLFIGDKKRPVNTAEGGKRSKIDRWEQKALLKLAKDDPKAFLTRLLADSANGTPVEFTFLKEMGKEGILKIDFRAENGHVDTKATFTIFNKSADKYLKTYLAKNPREKGTRSSITLEVSGDLNKDAGLDNIKVEVRADNLPAFSAEKLMRLEEVKRDIQRVLSGKGRRREKYARVQDIVRRALKDASEVPVQFFIDLIRSHHEVEIDLKEASRETRVHATAGDSKIALTFQDILGGKDSKEADIEAKFGGTVADDRDTLRINEARIYNTDQVSISWGEDNRPVISRVDPATGEKAVIDDHLGEIMMYLPFAMALAGGKGIF